MGQTTNGAAGEQAIKGCFAPEGLGQRIVVRRLPLISPEPYRALGLTMLQCSTSRGPTANCLGSQLVNTYTIPPSGREHAYRRAGFAAAAALAASAIVVQMRSRKAERDNPPRGRFVDVGAPVLKSAGMKAS
jgi:hypothetical protein